jgi:hypothetical protein
MLSLPLLAFVSGEASLRLSGVVAGGVAGGEEAPASRKERRNKDEVCGGDDSGVAVGERGGWLLP